jgi:transcriptional regulator GlxA family with amidase domain
MNFEHRDFPNQAPIGEVLARAWTSLSRSHTDQRTSLVEVCALLEDARGRAAGHEAQGVVKGGLATWQLQRAMQYVESRIHEPIKVDELAAIARLSTRHFARAFRHSYGMSPHAFIVRRRIAHAKRLMLSTGMPLSEIALACGTCDQAHLSHLFKAACGLPPLQWRRRHASPAGSEPQREEVGRTPVAYVSSSMQAS